LKGGLGGEGENKYNLRPSVRPSAHQYSLTVLLNDFREMRTACAPSGKAKKGKPSLS